jgi:hypothetical protein
MKRKPYALNPFTFTPPREELLFTIGRFCKEIIAHGRPLMISGFRRTPFFPARFFLLFS